MDHTSFENLNLSESLLHAIRDIGYTGMTGIQQRIIPSILEGRDVIGQSSTGTGKTAAFSIPLVEMTLEDGGPNPQVLVLSPTRELAMQISEEFTKIAKYRTGIHIATVYGGQNISVQFQALKYAQIVVGTPGRVIDHIHRGTLELKDIRTVVLDEADKMLDMGFVDDISAILRCMPSARQTLLFSATMPAPVLRITQRFQRDPELIKGDDGQTAFELISQYYIEVPKSKKANSIKLLFETQGIKRSLIFCNTKIMVDILARHLNNIGLSARALHGDMQQAARTKATNQFKDGSVDVLVATDVAARGIDVSGIDAIINYDIPQDIEYYIHRIGRTGRAGHLGDSYTLVTGHGDFFALADIENATKIPLTQFILPGVEDLPDDRKRDSSAKEGKKKNPLLDRQGEKVSGKVVLSVDVGSFHDINEGHIIDSIIQNSRLRKGDIGSITIGEHKSYIELSGEHAQYAVKALKDATVDDFVVLYEVESGGAPAGGSSRRSGGNRRRRPNKKPK